MPVWKQTTFAEYNPLLVLWPAKINRGMWWGGKQSDREISSANRAQIQSFTSPLSCGFSRERGRERERLEFMLRRIDYLLNKQIWKPCLLNHDWFCHIFANIKKEKRREEKIEEKRRKEKKRKGEEKMVANSKHFLIYGLFLYTKM